MICPKYLHIHKRKKTYRQHNIFGIENGWKWPMTLLKITMFTSCKLNYFVWLIFATYLAWVPFWTISYAIVQVSLDLNFLLVAMECQFPCSVARILFYNQSAQRIFAIWFHITRSNQANPNSLALLKREKNSLNTNRKQFKTTIDEIKKRTLKQEKLEGKSYTEFL